MTVAEAVRERILDLGAVTAIVGQRVTNALSHQSSVPPFVRVQEIDELEGAHLRGADGVFRARVQVDSVALSKAAADDLDAAIKGDGAGSGLAFWSGSLGSPAFVVDVIRPDNKRDFYEPEELRQHRVSRDYIVQFRGYTG